MKPHFGPITDGLLVLQIGLQVGNVKEKEVSLRLHYRGESRSELISSLEFRWAEFGLVDHLARDDMRADNPFKRPSDLARQLKKALDARFVSGFPTPLWIEFESPAGYLALMPWEKWLCESLRTPILRLPGMQTMSPFPVGSRLNVAICASVPEAKGNFPAADYVAWCRRAFLDAWSDLPVEIDIFVDEQNVEATQRAIETHPSNHDRETTTCLNPNEALAFPLPNDRKLISAPAELRSPWLRWMQDALRGKAIDVVCFVTHGYFAGDRGALALAESPLVNEDPYWARFVGAAELSLFMAQIGAWASVVVAPQGNFSDVGLRSVVSELSSLRPCVSLHVGTSSVSGKSFNATLRYTTGRSDTAPPIDEEVVSYVQPHSQREDSEAPIAFSCPSDGFRLVKSLPRLTSEAYVLDDADKGAPTWAVRAERYLYSVEGKSMNESDAEDATTRTLERIRSIIQEAVKGDLGETP